MYGKIDEVCAIIDAQGFTMNNHFYPREISIISHTLKETILVDTYLRISEMSKKDRITNYYLQNNILGLSLGLYDLSLKHKQSDDPIQILTNLYDKVKTDKRKYIGVKNQQIIELLNECNIPFIKLEEYYCPSFDRLKQWYGGKHCHFHEREVPDRRKLRCADHKCQVLWKWYIDYWRTH